MGMNFFPLCTASVCPTNSGVMVDRRDQVLMTLRSWLRFISSIFWFNFGSTYGPFFSDRPISSPLAVGHQRASASSAEPSVVSSQRHETGGGRPQTLVSSLQSLV